MFGPNMADICVWAVTNNLGLGCNFRPYSASHILITVVCVEVSCPSHSFSKSEKTTFNPAWKLFFENLCFGSLIRQFFWKCKSLLLVAANWLLNIVEPINLLVGYRQDYYSIVKMSRKRCRYTTNFVLRVSSKWTSDNFSLVWKKMPSN